MKKLKTEKSGLGVGVSVIHAGADLGFSRERGGLSKKSRKFNYFF